MVMPIHEKTYYLAWYGNPKVKRDIYFDAATNGFSTLEEAQEAAMQRAAYTDHPCVVLKLDKICEAVPHTTTTVDIVDCE